MDTGPMLLKQSPVCLEAVRRCCDLSEWLRQQGIDADWDCNRRSLFGGVGLFCKRGCGLRGVIQHHGGSGGRGEEHGRAYEAETGLGGIGLDGCRAAAGGGGGWCAGTCRGHQQAAASFCARADCFCYDNMPGRAGPGATHHHPQTFFLLLYPYLGLTGGGGF